MSVKVTDNSKQILSAMEKAIERGVEAIGTNAEYHAKRDPSMPVDTGLARNSITHAVSGKPASIGQYTADRGDGHGSYSGTAPIDEKKAVYIGSNVEYFPAIELGARNINARHVLQRAATEHKDEYRQLMEDSMKNA